MDRDPAWYCEAIESGEADRVAAAIEALRQTWPEERPRLMEVCVPRCRDLFLAGEWYQRQSAVRFLRELVDATEGLSAAELEAVEDEARFWAAVERTLLAGVRDDDGRVRQSAVVGVETLAAAYRREDDEAGLDRLRGVLGTLRLVADDDAVTHVEDARAAVRATAVGEDADASAAGDDGDEAAGSEQATADGERAVTDGETGSPRLACPRCGGPVERWRLDDRETVSCEDCAYQGVPVGPHDDGTERESWDEALERFRERVAAESPSHG